MPELIIGVQTMSNPDMLSPSELREELISMQSRNIELSIKLGEVVDVAHRQSALLSGLIDAHEANDQATIAESLGQLSAYRAKINQQAKKQCN